MSSQINVARGVLPVVSIERGTPLCSLPSVDVDAFSQWSQVTHPTICRILLPLVNVDTSSLRTTMSFSCDRSDDDCGNRGGGPLFKAAVIPQFKKVSIGGLV